MNYAEQAVVFACDGVPLVSVLSAPERASETAVIIIVGGPQYRAGSHRQFVLLARALASAGHAVMRFDYRGMGDSGGEQRSFEHVSDDIGAAIGCVFERVAGVRRVVLWGLCDAASAALLYCHDTRDARVAGLCLLNPWVRSEVGLARTQVRHYYSQRLMQREFWVKLLRGSVAVGALGELWKSLRIVAAGRGAPSGPVLSYQQRMAAAWADPERALLLILSGRDQTAQEFIDACGSDPSWAGAMRLPGLQRHDMPDADHTFSDPQQRRQVEHLTLAWLAALDSMTHVAEPGLCAA